MRSILGTRRSVENGALEDWVPWMIRATREVDQVMEKHNIPSWVEEYLKTCLNHKQIDEQIMCVSLLICVGVIRLLM